MGLAVCAGDALFMMAYLRFEVVRVKIISSYEGIDCQISNVCSRYHPLNALCKHIKHDMEGEDGSGEDQETSRDVERVNESDEAAQDVLETDAERQERLSISLSFLDELFSREHALEPFKAEVEAMLADEAKLGYCVLGRRFSPV